MKPLSRLSECPRWRSSAAIFALLSFGLPLYSQQLPDLYTSEMHGDPPFLRQEGWQPLIHSGTLDDWRAAGEGDAGWQTTRSVNWRRVWDPKRLTVSRAPGDRIYNGPEGKAQNLVTIAKFGDFELYLEFLLARGSNSGVYLHGLYEVQLFDSHGYDGALTVGDCGGIYAVTGSRGGSPPLRNAARPPGEWQSLHIWFRAPRFDAAGRKTQNARILRVLLNDTLVQNEFEVAEPTLGSLQIPEAPENPIMLQGDHGPVAFRNLYIRHLKLE